MALAVTILSPVTILTVIPALWQSLMESGTYFLGISLTPMTANKIKLSFSH
jgi:accessory gene regulator protein AgrB